MTYEIERNFKNSIETLEDLYSLGEVELFPVVEQLHYHLSSMYRSFFESQEKENELSNLRKILEESVDKKVFNFFEKGPSGTQFNYWKNTEGITLKEWDKLVSIIPYAFEAISLFSFKEEVEFGIYKENLVIKGQVSMEENLLSKRKKAYFITKKLLDLEALLSFDVFESKENGNFYLELKLNYSFTKDFTRYYQFQNGYTLGISAGFSDYKIPIDRLIKMPKHQYIFIDENGLVKESKQLDRKVIEKKKDKEVLHFPFLFRPVSMIISKEGKIASLSEIVSYLDTGCGLELTGQDVSNTKNSKYTYANLFNLFS